MNNRRHKKRFFKKREYMHRKINLIDRNVNSEPKKVESRTEKLREWLEKNKIFFEVFVTTALSFMAIFLSFKANSIYEYQALIAQQQVMPQFDVIRHQIYNEIEQKYTENVISIYNQGGAITNFKYDTAVFYHVEYTDNNGKYKTKDIPINGYYFSGELSGQSKGILVKLSGYHNNKKYINLKRKLMDYSKKNNKDSVLLNVKEYIKINYKDILNKFHTEYYRVTIGQAILISNEEGEKLFKRYNNGFKNNEMIDIDNITSENFVNMLWKQ